MTRISGTIKALTVRGDDGEASFQSDMFGVSFGDGTRSVFALENFDATGHVEEIGIALLERPIDSRGESCPDGTQIKGPDDLRKALLRRPDQFAQTFTEGLLVVCDRSYTRVLRHASRAQDGAPMRLQSIINFHRWSNPWFTAISSKMRRVPQPAVARAAK